MEYHQKRQVMVQNMMDSSVPSNFSTSSCYNQSMESKQHTDSFLDSQWLSIPEGQLSVDVHETPTEVIVRSAIAGVLSKDLEIVVSNDTLTIRGTRHSESKTKKGTRTHIQECHWGAFSRSIILPSHVDPNKTKATLQRGILTVVMKKIEMDKHVPVLDLEDV